MDSPVYISFIVSIYNVSEFLDDCVQSLCQIQNPQIEILLIDDGSTDNCPAICQKYAQQDGRVRVITQENQGLPMSRNTGLKHAGGKFVCFVDGDDCLSDDFDGRIIQQIDDAMDINYFGYQRMIEGKIPEWIDRGGYFLKEKDMREVRLRILNRDIYRDPRKFPDTVLCEASWGKFVNREKLLEWKISFDKNVSWGEDLLFNFKLLQHVKQAKVIDCTGYYYRINAASMTRKYSAQAGERFQLLAEAMGIEVEKSGSEGIRRQYQVFVIKQLLQCVQRDMLNSQNSKPYRERRADYRRLRYMEAVRNALKAFPYKSVRVLYKVAICIVSSGSYRLLWLFYQIKRLKEKAL